MIEISNLTKKFKKLIAVNDLSLEINDNEVFALLGLNGAGKTTTINILCSLINKDSGKVIINNLDLDITKKEIKQIINVSPQETAICGNLTVYENLEIIAKLYGIENYQQKINAIIDKFYLKEKEKNLAKSLSGGQKKD